MLLLYELHLTSLQNISVHKCKNKTPVPLVVGFEEVVGVLCTGFAMIKKILSMQNYDNLFMYSLNRCKLLS